MSASAMLPAPMNPIEWLARIDKAHGVAPPGAPLRDRAADRGNAGRFRCAACPRHRPGPAQPGHVAFGRAVAAAGDSRRTRTKCASNFVARLYRISYAVTAMAGESIGY